MIALADAGEEGGEDTDLLGVLGGADGDAFLEAVAPLAGFVLLNAAKEIVARLSEVEDPSMGWVEIVRLDEA